MSAKFSTARIRNYPPLQIDVRRSQNCETGGLVAATRLETNESVLNNVNTTNTVTTSDGVGGEEELDRVGDSLDLLDAGGWGVFKLDRKALVEGNGEIFWRIGGILL